MTIDLWKNITKDKYYQSRIKDNLAGMPSLDFFQLIIHNLLSNCVPEMHIWQPGGLQREDSSETTSAHKFRVLIYCYLLERKARRVI